MSQIQICTCGLLKQKPAMVGSVETCTRCYKPINIPAAAFVSGEVSEGAPQGASAPSAAYRANSDSPVTNAKSAAANLKSAALVLAVLGAIGGIILAIVGFVPQCPAGLGDCYSDEKSMNITLIATGIVGALFWWWVFAVSNAIAARVDLAAHEAERR